MKSYYDQDLDALETMADSVASVGHEIGDVLTIFADDENGKTVGYRLDNASKNLWLLNHISKDKPALSFKFQIHDDADGLWCKCDTASGLSTQGANTDHLLEMAEEATLLYLETKGFSTRSFSWVDMAPDGRSFKVNIGAPSEISE